MRKLVACLVALVATSATSQAVFINFDSLPASTNISGAPNNPASVLTNQFGNVGVLFGRTGVSAGVAVINDGGNAFSLPNGIAGLDNAGNIPSIVTGDIYFSFVTPNTTTPSSTDLVSFYIGDSGGDTDIWQVRAYNLAGLLISSQNVSGASHQFVSINLPGIHRVEVDFSGSFGYYLDDLTFNTPAATEVPEPVSLVVFGGLLVGGAGVALRRRMTKKVA